MRKTFIIMGMTIALAMSAMAPAMANPNVDARIAACDAIEGVYDDGGSSSQNTATCTVTTTDTVTDTTQVNNIKAAKQVLRTTTTTITYETVYGYTAVREMSETGTDGDPEEGETELVMCTPGSGYDACPDNKTA